MITISFPKVTVAPKEVWDKPSSSYKLFVINTPHLQPTEARILQKSTFIGSWRDELSDIYVTENGYAYYIRTNDPVHFTINVKGYIVLIIAGKFMWGIHRLIANAFVFNPDSTTKNQVNHKDGEKTNNCAYNLEWCTNQENMSHAISSGLICRKFDTDQILYIRSLYPANTQQQIATRYNISLSMVNHILHGKAYGDIETQPIEYRPVLKGENARNAIFTNEQIWYIRSNYPTMSMNELGRMFGVDPSCIGNIINNYTYVDDTYVPPNTFRSGTGHHLAKLSQEQIDYIRSCKGIVSHTELASQHRVSSTTITNILNNKTYKDK